MSGTNSDSSTVRSKPDPDTVSLQNTSTIILINFLKTTLLLSYIPLGLLLVATRCLLSIQICVALAILPEESIFARIIRRVFSVILGMLVLTEGFEYRQQAARVLIAYRTTNLAHIAIRIALPIVTLDTKNLLMGWLFGQTKAGDSTFLKYEAEKIISKRIEVRPVLSLTAETKSYRFEEWPFCIYRPLHTLIVTHYIPFLPSYIKLPSTAALDLFFLFFFPITFFTVSMQPMIRREQQEMTQEFRRRAETFIQQKMTRPHPTFSSTGGRADAQPDRRRATIMPDNVSERAETLATRKNQLIQNNRAKFIAKYGSDSISS